MQALSPGASSTLSSRRPLLSNLQDATPHHKLGFSVKRMAGKEGGIEKQMSIVNEADSSVVGNSGLGCCRKDLPCSATIIYLPTYPSTYAIQSYGS